MISSWTGQDATPKVEEVIDDEDWTDEDRALTLPGAGGALEFLKSMGG